MRIQKTAAALCIALVAASGVLAQKPKALHVPAKYEEALSAVSARIDADLVRLKQLEAERMKLVREVEYLSAIRSEALGDAAKSLASADKDGSATLALSPLVSEQLDKLMGVQAAPSSTPRHAQPTPAASPSKSRTP